MGKKLVTMSLVVALGILVAACAEKEALFTVETVVTDATTEIDAAAETGAVMGPEELESSMEAAREIMLPSEEAITEGKSEGVEASKTDKGTETVKSMESPGSTNGKDSPKTTNTVRETESTTPSQSVGTNKVLGTGTSTPPVSTDGTQVSSEPKDNHEHSIAYRWLQKEEIGQCLVHARYVDICSECGYIERVLKDYGIERNCVLGEVVWLKGGEGDCTQESQYTQFCINCGIQDSIRTVQYRHAYDSGSIVEYIVRPTCVSGGRWKLKYTCRGCGDTYYKEEDCPKRESHGATYLSEIISEPTCTELGYARWSCQDCGQHIADAPYADALRHVDYNQDGVCDRCSSQIGN